MHFTSEQRLDDGVLEREFTLNGLPKADPRLGARARYTAARGYAVAGIDAVGCGDRPRFAAGERARADLRRAMQAGEPVDEILECFIGPLVENAVPEWRTTLDALLELPDIGGPVGYSGGTALGIRLARVEPRIVAAGFFAGGYVARARREEARQVTIPLLFLLQWDDEGNPRQRTLDLFDAFATKEKTLRRQSGQAHRHPVVRSGGRVPVLRQAPEARPGCPADSRR